MRWFNAETPMLKARMFHDASSERPFKHCLSLNEAKYPKLNDFEYHHDDAATGSENLKTL